MSAERVIDRPTTEVAAFFFDATNNPMWQSGMVRCEWEGAEGMAVGSTYVQEARFMGRPIRSRFEVTEFTPSRSITVRTVESTFPIQVTRTVDPLDESSCRVRAVISGGPGGPMKLLTPLTKRLAQRAVDRDYDRLVEFLERPES